MAWGTSVELAVKLAIGQQMGKFYQQISADTPLVQEFTNRGLAKSIVWVPARMIDSVEAMLTEWRANHNNSNNNNKPGSSPMLPVMMVALAREFESADPQWGRAVSEALPFIHAEDPYARLYKLRTTFEAQRMQVVVIAPEPHSARSLASQFVLFCQSHLGRSFTHQKEHAGCKLDFPVQLADLNLGAVDAAIEQKNLTILTIDLSWLITMPYIQAPASGEANDGQPAPAGYPVVQQVAARNSASGVRSDSAMDENGRANTEYPL